MEVITVRRVGAVTTSELAVLLSFFLTGLLKHGSVPRLSSAHPATRSTAPDYTRVLLVARMLENDK